MLGLPMTIGAAPAPGPVSNLVEHRVSRHIAQRHRGEVPLALDGRRLRRRPRARALATRPMRQAGCTALTHSAFILLLL